MTSLLLMIGIPLVMVVSLTVVSNKVLRRTRPLPVDSRFPALMGAWGITERSRLVGIALGVVVLACGPVLIGHQFGLSIVLGPAAAALTCVLSLLVGQQLIGRSVAGDAAGVEVRTVRRYAPRALLRACWAGAALLVPALGAGCWYASDGRFFRGTARDDAGQACSFSMSPFLGSHYVVPLAGALVLLGCCAVLAARATVVRPRNGAETAIVIVDDEVRRRAVTAVLGATAAAAWASLLILLTNFRVVANNVRANGAMPGGCGPDLAEWPENVLGFGALLALGVTLWCLDRVFRPGGTHPVDLDDLA